MPIFSLPSAHGIGTLGAEARRFVDFLVDARQSWWQMLPVGPTSYGDSPYQSFSTYAGNPYFIDLDELEEAGLLDKREIAEADRQVSDERVDYGAIYNTRHALLRSAAERGLERREDGFRVFCEKNAGWLDDYALYTALKGRFGMKPWYEWDEDIRLRRPDALRRYREELRCETEIRQYIQYLFYTQWDALRDYARQKKIGIIGDMPIYVAFDSADVWASPESFQLDEKNCPKAVAGVPPDYFSEDGQLWGNPLYDWDAMKKDGYGWWIRRVEGASRLYDMIRFDHFRGFHTYWSVPAGETTAKKGHWVNGPGLPFVKMLTSWFYGLSFIAEDLGDLSDEVHEFVEKSELPGMNVLEFAFDGNPGNHYLLHNIKQNSVCYVGTHDNAPVCGWASSLSEREKRLSERYLGLNDREGVNFGMIRAGMQSNSFLFVAQMSDYLGLGDEARINTPGLAWGNWGWRMRRGSLTAELAEKIADYAVMFSRASDAPPKPAEKTESGKTDSGGRQQDAETETDR